MSAFTVALVAFAVPIALVLMFTPLMFKASRREGARRAAEWASYVERFGMIRTGKTTRGVRSDLQVLVVEDGSGGTDNMPLATFTITLPVRPTHLDALWMVVAAPQRDLVPGAWQLEGSTLTRTIGSRSAEYGAELEVGLSLGHALVEAQTNLSAGLLARVLQGSDAQVKTKALQLLSKLQAEDGQSAEGIAVDLRSAIRAALTQPAPDLRFAAAELAGDVAEIAALAAQGYPPALVALITLRRPRDEIRHTVDRWLADDLVKGPERAAAFVQAIGLLLAPAERDADDIPRAQRDAYEARVIALIDPDAAAVGSDNIHMMREVLNLLEEVGTVAAIPRLLAFAATRKDPFGLGEVACDAVVAIRARIVDGEAGGLALAEAAGGELAVAETTSKSSSADREAESPQRTGGA